MKVEFFQARGETTKGKHYLTLLGKGNEYTELIEITPEELAYDREYLLKLDPGIDKLQISAIEACAMYLDGIITKENLASAKRTGEKIVIKIDFAGKPLTLEISEA